jgi:hypothetical protein
VAETGTAADGLVQTIETPARADGDDSPDELDGFLEAIVDDQEARGLYEPAPPKPGWQPILPPSTPAEESFRHSGWQTQRQRLRDALERTGTSKKTLDAWDCCGSAAYVMQHKESGALRVAANYCHHRLCLPCQRARSRLIASNVRANLTGRWYSHIVLTLASSDDPLTKQIDRIYAGFKKLRATKQWKQRVQGGAAFFELTRNDRLGQWHPHLHILVEARYFPQKVLSALWLKVTGDSYIVHVSAVRDRDAAASEVAKYVTKPLSPTLFADQDALDEFVTSIKGRRLCLTFGNWFKIRLCERPNKYDPLEWETLGRLEDIIHRADGGELHAKIVLDLLAGVIQCQARPPPPGQPRFDFPDGPPAPSVAAA